MFYGSETWVDKTEDVRGLEWTEMKMARWMWGISLNDGSAVGRILNEQVGYGEYCTVQYTVNKVMHTGRLRWFGHIERMERESWEKWSMCKINNLRVKGPRRNAAYDHKAWRGATMWIWLLHVCMYRRPSKMDEWMELLTVIGYTELKTLLTWKEAMLYHSHILIYGCALCLDYNTKDEQNIHKYKWEYEQDKEENWTNFNYLQTV